jgi:hypothetical protein
MTNRPSVPEIITVNSEALQTQIRQLLPSQNGFGSELQASNVITPIIDLTTAAEGSALPVNLQQALAFASQTAFSISATSTTLASSPGFWRVSGNVFMVASGECKFRMTDGLATKTLYTYELAAGSSSINVPFDYLVWLRAGDSVDFDVNGNAIAHGSFRQVGDAQGNLVQPSGFPL